MPAEKTGRFGRLFAQLDALGQGHAKVVRHAEKSWASITFDGSRHTIELLFDGEEAVAAGEEFIAALPDHEFVVPGQFVAEATVKGAEHVLLPYPRLTVECELLLLRDA